MFEIGIYILLGFIAEIIDGCLGMAYGIFLTSCLAFTGLNITIISPGVHCAEIFVNLSSGFSHLKLGNVNKRLLKKLLIPGIIGGILGAVSLKFINGDILKPFISVYLIILGLRIFFRAIKDFSNKFIEKDRFINFIGFFGGYLDALGGGGWGPIVTGSLIAKGNNPRETIGTVNLAEFFVTVVQSLTFFVLIGLAPKNLILGLMIGGIVAAPIAALLCKKINPKPLMILVSLTIILINIINLIRWAMKVL